MSLAGSALKILGKNSEMVLTKVGHMRLLWTYPSSAESTAAQLEAIAGRFFSEWLRSNKKLRRPRVTLRTELHCDGTDVEAAVKIFFRKEPFPFNWLAGALKRHALTAYRNARKLSRMGVPVPLPLGVGFCRPCRHSFVTVLISRWEEDSQKFLEALREAIEERNTEVMKQMLALLGRFVAMLHRNGVYHGDLNLRNVLMRKHETEVRFVLVDLDRLKFGKPWNKGKCMKDLMQINCGLYGRLRKDERLDLYRAYAEASPLVSDAGALESLLERLDRMTLLKAARVSRRFQRKLNVLWEHSKKADMRAKDGQPV
jgi:tRNA A-37 threonylcarbamoyl transferase component Bud32